MEKSTAHAKFIRHVRGWPFEEIDNAERALRALRDSPGWAVLQQILKAESAAVDARLDHADEPLDAAKYALLHGQRSGLTAPGLAVEAVLVHHAEQVARLLESDQEPAGAGGR